MKRAPAPPDRYRYRIYGLILDSEIQLPELGIAGKRTGGSGDISFGFTDRALPVGGTWFAASAPSDGYRWLTCAKAPRGYIMEFPRCAVFWVDRFGHKIICGHIRPAIAPETIRHLLLDQVLPLVLNLRGCDALHATAVLTPAGVCAFAGVTGSGKSTLAASFLSAGYPVLADDCLVLRPVGGRLQAVPAYPGIRLAADSFSALWSKARASTLPVAHYSAKLRVIVAQNQGAARRAYPLARIFVIDRHRASASVQPRLAPLGGRAAMRELIEHLYRFDVTDAAMLRRQFALLHRVVTQVPIRRLTVAGGFRHLAAARALILADAASSAVKGPSLARPA